MPVRIHPPTGTRSRTKQADRQDCDINAIMRRYAASGVMGHARDLEGVYGDFSNSSDYHHHMNRVRAAEEHFLSLPAQIRDACHNDPAVLVDIATNPDRKGEFERLNEILGVKPPESSEPTTDPAAEPEPEEKPPEADA